MIPGEHKKFSLSEDNLLSYLVSKYGHNWKLVSSFMPNRSSRQCRERYINYLSPDLKNEPWTEEEDNLLMTKASELGPKWSKILSFFPTRSYVSVKNRWNILKTKTTPKARLDIKVSDQNDESLQSKIKLPPIDSSHSKFKGQDNQLQSGVVNDLSTLPQQSALSSSFPFYGGYVW